MYIYTRIKRALRARTGLRYRVASRNHIMELYYGHVLHNDSPDHISETYHGIMLGNHMTDLRYGST